MSDLYGKITENFVTEDGLIDEESLHQWFKGGGWRQAGGKYDGKPCARQPGQKTTPKCVSRKKYKSMSKKQRDSAGRRKRKKDPNQTKKRGAAKPTYVKTDPQKGGRKKKKKSKKNEDIYMKLEQMVQEELEKVLNEEGTAPTSVGLPNDIGTPEKLLAGLAALDIEKTDYNQANVIVNFINKSLMKNPSEDVDNALRDYKEKIADHHKFANTKSRRDQKRADAQRIRRPFGSDSEANYRQNPFGIVPEEVIKEELKAVLDEKRKKKKKKKKKGGKKDACYYKVKSRYKVWPSAYASGALVKCRKVGAKNWGNSKKENLQAIVEDELTQVLVEKKKKKKKSAKDRMKCNSSRRIRKGEPGHGKKKFVVKACEGGKEKIIRYGDANMEIKKDSPARRKSFRARHNCKNPGSKLKARYWSCKKW